MTSALELPGIVGTSPLGFMGALGLIRVLERADRRTRLGFVDGGCCHAIVSACGIDLPALIAEDALAAGADDRWRLSYRKVEKRGEKQVADLKAPPGDFAKFVLDGLGRWRDGDGERVAYAAAYATTVAVDNKGNTKPTAFHFTAANQQFLDTVEKTRSVVTEEWARASLFDGDARRPGSNLRWDPSAERNWALMAANPVSDGTSVDAPLEWLAFRGLPLLPTYPVGSRIITSCVQGRGESMQFSWPLWSHLTSLRTARSLIQSAALESAARRAARGVFALCTATIRRTSQGFGNFGPALVRP